MKKFSKIATAILFVFSIFLSVGVGHLFPACQGMAEHGGVMRCHWAENSVAMVAAILALIYFVAFFVKDMKLRAGMLLASVPVAAGAILLVSNTVILLCMTKTMHCWMVMKPAVTASAAVIVVLAMVNFVITFRTDK